MTDVIPEVTGPDGPFTEFSERDRALAEAMLNPYPGLTLTEFYSWYAIVLDVLDTGHVLVMEAIAPCSLPKDGYLRLFPSVEAFRKHYEYGTIPHKYPAWQAKDTKVEGWSARCERWFWERPGYRPPPAPAAPRLTDLPLLIQGRFWDVQADLTRLVRESTGRDDLAVEFEIKRQL